MYVNKVNIQDDVLSLYIMCMLMCGPLAPQKTSTRTRADWDKSVLGFIAMNE